MGESMSLTGHLKDPASPIRSFMEEHFPRSNKPWSKWNKTTGPTELHDGDWEVVDAQTSLCIERQTLRHMSPPLPTLLPNFELGYPWVIAGTAIDYRIRFFFDTPQPEKLIAEQGAAILPSLLGQPCKSVRYYDELKQVLTVLTCDNDLRGRLLDEGMEVELCRLCICLALFDPVFRAGAVAPLDSIPLDSPLEALLSLVKSAVVDDVVALSARFYQTQRDLLEGRIFHLNPNFGSYSRLIGGADADLIVDSVLIDIKTKKSFSITQQDLWQLIGYLLLDRDDEYEIKELGIYMTRQGVLYKWAVDEFLFRLSRIKRTTAQWRADFYKLAKNLERP